MKFFKKILRFTDFDFPQGIVVFRDHTIIINWSENPTAIHIESKKITDQYKKFFEQLWKLARE